ncbi:helix-turn-helix transcriptional regulator [Paenibacillus sp. sptzw28]|nr:helix-turn-helix domain-containing protein [Paenibacillus sp. sptzw28]QYR22478.1 helix-turn-helix transcriptional regulator [Paenibacillus sp. sptzw28]
MSKYGEEFMKCPIFTTQSLIGGKWKVFVLWMLHDGPKRFSELQKTLPQVTQAMLTNTLRDLEGDGLIHREVYRQVPPKVEYSLTPIGLKLIPILQLLVEWGIDYMETSGETTSELTVADKN